MRGTESQPPTVVTHDASNAGCSTSLPRRASLPAISTTSGTLLTMLEPTIMKMERHKMPLGVDALKAGSIWHHIRVGTSVRERPCACVRPMGQSVESHLEPDEQTHKQQQNRPVQVLEDKV